MQVISMSEFVRKECKKIQKDMRSLNETKHGRDKGIRRLEALIFEACESIINQDGDCLKFLQDGIREEREKYRVWLEEAERTDYANQAQMPPRIFGAIGLQVAADTRKVKPVGED